MFHIVIEETKLIIIVKHSLTPSQINIYLLDTVASRYELKKSDLKGVDFKLESLIQASTAIDCLIPLKETMRCVVAGRKAVHFRISLKYDTLTAEVYSWTEYESHHNIEATAIH